MSKLCLVFNDASLYREAIYTKIDQEYNCDWYFEKSDTDIKEMDLKKLKRTYFYKTIGHPTSFYWQKGIVKLLFKKEYDKYFILLETRSLSTTAFLLLHKLFFRNKKVYIWGHGWYGKETFLETLIKKFQFKMVDGSFLYGNRAKEIMIQHGFDGNKIFVIHNSLDYDKQVVLRHELSTTDIYQKHFGNSYPTIIFIGRLTQVKRLDLLLDAVKFLKDQGDLYNIALIGDGNIRKDLETQAGVLGIRNQVWFYGACYDEKENAELIYNADLCVAPGNIGLTAMHTLMFGCPAISHDDFKWQMPEFESIKPNITGNFFKKDDASSLANIISKWFKDNGTQRQTIREACFKEIDDSWNPYYQMSVIKKNLL